MDNRNVITFAAFAVLSALGTDKLQASSNSTISATFRTEQLESYYKYANATFSDVVNLNEEIKKQIQEYCNLNAAKELSSNLVQYFTDNNLELPDVSPSEDGSIIFEFSDNDLHYAIEIFDSGLISYFTNKNGEDEFLNSRNLEVVKVKLLEDFGTQQL